MKDPTAPDSPQYLRQLNQAQRAAVLALEGPVLVLAGAGSGKTRTIVQRIVHLLESGVQARHVLAVTFTNRAAQEMRERVLTAAGRRARAVTLSTFHSLGARLLREHGPTIGLPANFAIYSTADQLALLRRILGEEVHISPTAGDESFDIKRVLSRISGWKNRLIDPATASSEVAASPVRGNRRDDYEVLAADLYPRYEQALRAAGACDFDDLLLKPIELLSGDAEVRDRLWRRWHYLMIDEYQDTNAAQLELARLLAGPRRNLCVVGDDDQSIYAWRGADLRNILEFERHFGGAQVIALEENYRSTQRILDAANGLIAHNRARKEKWMRTGNGPGPKIDYWEFGAEPGKSAEEAEAAMVAREVGIRRFHEKLRWRDFAILYRANHQARPVEEALRQGNIPYRVVGGTSYFDRKEIADLTAYLRLLIYPRDDLSFRRIVNFPTRGIGRTTLLRLIEAGRERLAPLSEVIGAASELGFSGAQREALEKFRSEIESARGELSTIEAEAKGSPAAAGKLAAWVADFVERVGLEDALRAEAVGPRAAEIRVDNLRDFIASIARYERRTWAESPLPDEELDWSPPSLQGFLQTAALSRDEDGDDQRDSEADEVTLLTLHSAKGLEFSHVFLVGLEEEILPHARSVQEAATSDADPIAEERRLLYVGITRARHRLTLSGCKERKRGSETLPRQPSRFLKEIPSEVIEFRSGETGSSLSESGRQELRQNFFAQMREMLGN